jgi:hypothetical protein
MTSLRLLQYHGSTCPGPGELPVLWNNDRAFFSKKNLGHVQALKSRNKETEYFHLWNYFLNEVFTRQTINAG